MKYQVGHTWESKKGSRKIVEIGETFQGMSAVIRTGDNPMGAIVLLSDLEWEIQRDLRNLQFSIKDTAKQTKRVRESAVVEATLRNLYGFEKTMSPMVAGRAIKTLTRQRSISGEVLPLKEHIEWRVDDGWRVVYQPGRKFEVIFQSPKGSFFVKKDLTAVGFKYAEYLAGE